VGKRRRKHCGNKIKYDNQDQAGAALGFLRKNKLRKGLSPYKCSVCGKWHIGHAPRRGGGKQRFQHKKQENILDKPLIDGTSPLSATVRRALRKASKRSGKNLLERYAFKEREPFLITIDEFEQTETGERLKQHIHAWCETHHGLFAEVIEELGLSGDDDEAGADLFFTSNGHGVGYWSNDYWDGDWQEYGDMLTAAAEKFPELDFYVGDDGNIYEFPELEIPVERKY